VQQDQLDFISDRLQEVEPSLTLMREALQSLNEKRTQLRATASQSNTREELRSSVYLLVLVIGAFGVLSILSIYVFPDNVVMEWVSSGQVIQFVTVTILLSVVLSLGLSGILEQDTLGTLLVLSWEELEDMSCRRVWEELLPTGHKRTRKPEMPFQPVLRTWRS
jgi:hypothetical protein